MSGARVEAAIVDPRSTPEQGGIGMSSHAESDQRCRLASTAVSQDTRSSSTVPVLMQSESLSELLSELLCVDHEFY